MKTHGEIDKGMQILGVLKALYPDAQSELRFADEYQLVCAVLLSAQCTDKKVNQVTPALFLEYPDFKALAAAKLETVERLIGQVNYYRTKSKHLILMAQRTMQEFGGLLPRQHEQLVTLAGVGRKTANVVLGELGTEPRLAIDTHVYRVSRRLGLTRGKTVRKVEDSLTKQFAPSTWRSLHHGLILHGRRVCKAQNPQCSTCELKHLCKFGRAKPSTSE